MMRKNQIHRRLIKGFGANLLGRIWMILAQLLTVPILTYHWGVDGYGVWLMINAIPTYLALSDFGLGTAAGVEITKSVTQDDREEALRVYQSGWIILSFLTIGMGAIICTLALAWLKIKGGEAGPFSNNEVALTIILTTVAALIGIQTRYQRTIFDATHKYAIGTLLFDLNFLLSAISLMIVALAGGRIIEAAAAQVVVKFLLCLVYIIILRREEPWWRPGWSLSEIAIVKRLISPSFASFILAAGNSLGLQGIVLTIGWVISPAAAAIFATSRMLTRIPVQFAMLLTRASIPELTRAQTAGDLSLTKKLMRLNIGLVILVMAPATLLFTFTGPWLLQRLSHGKMTSDHFAFFLLGLAAALCAIWTALSTRFVSTNNQRVFAYLALGLYAIVALLPYLASERYHLILVGIVIADAGIAWRVAFWKEGKRT
ncbi:lipopolysaccharide biosynthesis protein [Mangrovicoccus sp. HB161399]|uniref:lipopolysaccharide biosynthesis protein n=1 Tax=Mangrovicoccus sp. HB161399 TaxID=2720392 RepID=UPI0015548881|nr:lipopolysaccharide biosynthesis protein [Mangrovicoccus sp. HB161399]